MTLTELAMATPGETVGHIRHGGGRLIDTTITKGVVPESNKLSADDAEVFVTIDSRGVADVAIGLEHIHDGRAELGIETLQGGAIHDPSYAQKLIIEAMHQSGVRCASLDPAIAPIPEAALPEVGFHHDSSEENYTFSLAA